MASPSTVDFDLHEKQGKAFLSQATEILYGGAAGGGKSHLMRVASIAWCMLIPGLQVYLFRRIREDLVKNHIEGPKGFRALLAPIVLCGAVTIVEDEIRFANGSKIYLCHCKDEKDRWKYLGAEMHVLLIDELTTFTEVIYRFLRGRVRAVGLPEMPEQFRGCFPRILASSNPGNIGHHWVKRTFIDPHPAMEVWDAPENEGGMRRQFIPARLDDNPSMAQDDPNYRARLSGLGNPALVKAMQDGDWDIVAGAYFEEWARDRHVIPTADLPESWPRYLSFDWGSARPFSVNWFAVVADENAAFPRGALIVYREWYGMQEGQENVGLKLTAEQIAEGIADRCSLKEHQGLKNVAGLDLFKEDGGPSLSERMYRHKKVTFGPADVSRLAGWDQVRSRLVGEDGRPMLYVMDCCRHLIRTLPMAQHDELRPEDIDTKGEDHACVVGETLVQTPAGPIRIDALCGSAGEVLSLGGKMRAYTTAAQTKRNAEVVRLTFEDGRELVCTPDHLILSESGFIPAKDCLDAISYAYSIDEGDACSQLLSATPSKSLRAGATISAASTSSAKASDSIGACMRRIMGPFRRAFTSTTATTTDPTTSPRIWNYWKALATSPATWMATGASRPAFASSPHSGLPRNGTGQKKGERGIVSITRTSRRLFTLFGRMTAGIAARFFRPINRDSAPTTANPHGVERMESITSSASAQSAAANTSPTSTLASTHAPALVARRLRIVSVQPAGRRDVYCLYVPETHVFAANGVLIHNCDSLRYGCMARPYVPPLPKDRFAGKPRAGSFDWLLDVTANKTKRVIRV